MMDQLSSEVLLKIFKQLNSREMVKIMRVCGRWFKVIDSNKSLWTSLVLPEDEGENSQSILDLFDRKSRSSLEEVDMKLALREEWELEDLLKVLTRLFRSKETLRILAVTLDEYSAVRFFSEASWNFPHLVDCRIINSLATRQVRIKARDQAPRKCLPSLKVLWIGERETLRNSTHLLANLSSLRLQCDLYSDECRDLLVPASKSLKHLDNYIDTYLYLDPDFLPSPLDFPQLQILELLCLDTGFPSWIKIPSSSTLIVPQDVRSELPSVSTLWTSLGSNLVELSSRCPVLVDIRLEVDGHKEKNSNLLLGMLRQRKENVRNHYQFDGIEMIPLKTLTIPFRYYEPDEISQMRSLVEEVIDLATVPDFIELEV